MRLFLLIFGCVVVEAAFNRMDEQPPEISLGSWKDSDFHSPWNETSSPPLGKAPFSDSIFVPSAVRGLSLVCNASYPIEWNFHRERWGGRTRLQFALQTTRYSDGLDVRSFSSELSIVGWGSSQSSGNYTCQKVGYSGLASNIYIFWEGNAPPFLTLAGVYRKPAQIPFQLASKRFTLPCSVSVPTIVPKLYKLINEKEVEVAQNRSVVYDPRVGFSLRNLKTPFGKYTCQVEDSENDDGSDDDVISFDVVEADDGPRPEFNETLRRGALFYVNSTSKQITCCSSSPKPPRIKLVECDHPTICALAKHTLHKMESAKDKNGGCASVKMHVLRAGIFRCVGDGIDIVREYFYPMPEQPVIPFLPGTGRRSGGGRKGGKGRKGNSNSTSPTPPPPPSVPEPFYSWNDANEEKMMAVTKITRTVYIGERRRFRCKASHFYFAQGIVWGISTTNASALDYVDGQHSNVSHFGNRHFDIIYGRNLASIDVTITSNLNRLICYAPVWNSTAWGKKVIELDPQVPSPPVAEGAAFTQVTWYLNDTNRKLECSFDGKPTPQVFWMKGNESYSAFSHTENGTSQLIFHLVGLKSQGEYSCEIENVAGNITRRFKVTVLNSSSSKMTILLVLSLVGVSILALAVGCLVRHVRSQKTVMQHLASLAFKDVQQNGNVNPTATFSNGNDRENITIPSISTQTPSSPIAFGGEKGNGLPTPSTNGFLNLSVELEYPPPLQPPSMETFKS